MWALGGFLGVFVARQKTTTEILDFVQNDGLEGNDGLEENDDLDENDDLEGNDDLEEDDDLEESTPGFPRVTEGT